MVEWSNDLYINPHQQSNLGTPSTLTSACKWELSALALIPLVCAGNEGMPSNPDADNDSGKGTMASYNSTSSLNESTSTVDSPEQFEELKQKKETIVAGIEL